MGDIEREVAKKGRKSTFQIYEAKVLERAPSLRRVTNLLEVEKYRQYLVDLHS